MSTLFLHYLCLVLNESMIGLLFACILRLRQTGMFHDNTGLYRTLENVMCLHEDKRGRVGEINRIEEQDLIVLCLVSNEMRTY